MAPPTSQQRRNGDGKVLFLYAILALIGLYTMRIVTSMTNNPVGFMDMFASRKLPDGTPLKTDYTGINPIDTGLAFLVSGFLFGPLRLNEAYYWQQIHFLPQLAPLIAIMNVEACRDGNRGKWLTYTAIWALFYQNIGGSFVITIWWMLFHYQTSPKSYYQTGRTVPLPYVRVMLPAIVFLYIIPTVAIWYPADKSISALQSVLAFWQWTPIFVNIPLWLVSLTSSLNTTNQKKNADVFHLRIMYAALFFFSVAVHWYSIYGISVSEHPDANYARVFIPSTYTWSKDIPWGLLWVFQWDWIIIGIMYIIPSWVAACDVQRMKKGEASLENVFESFLMIMTIAIGGGPGAALSAVWFWREGNLAAIEDASAVKKGQ
ncbi:hypothetical protein COCMIDRAFT_30728 [Bipolaris oryzae ATCC 44560]|uniref:Uncharacterized protein n=1 Tax=Bipolaris oryzae ATCC 44560 TaxID=930090 RepID=W6YM57_COCMI|nr:uncharacterized protein COCMIDRAFT_30728 [Bipolaris oryzae ATCC 44560]EUC40317.1 hypothetical protein COCMIDRAFT_30728 [Bipolaris oryzae ATCC 44560]